MTLIELAQHLLRHLGVLGVGEAASSEDENLAETAIANCQGELEQLGVALWTVDSIPDYAIEAFTAYCAPTLAGYFGKADAYPLQLKLVALRMLRELTQDQRTTTATADYF